MPRAAKPGRRSRVGRARRAKDRRAGRSRIGHRSHWRCRGITYPWSSRSAEAEFHLHRAGPGRPRPSAKDKEKEKEKPKETTYPDIQIGPEKDNRQRDKPCSSPTYFLHGSKNPCQTHFTSQPIPNPNKHQGPPPQPCRRAQSSRQLITSQNNPFPLTTATGPASTIPPYHFHILTARTTPRPVPRGQANPHQITRLVASSAASSKQSNKAAAYDKAVAIDPNNAGLVTNMGVALNKAGKVAESQEAFK